MSYVVEPGADPQEVRRRRRLAEALLQQGTDTSPILSPWQGAARLAQGLMGGIELGREDKRENDLLAANKAQDAEFSAALAKMYGGGGGAVSSALGAGKPMGPIKLDGFDSSLGRTLQFEGGVNPSDTNGTPSVNGINQKANPDVDLNRVQSDPAYRASIYRERYWNPIEADKMDPRLAHIAFDTSVIAGPGKAKELLAKSGGDPETFLKLREDFQNRLLQANPEKFGKYAKAWANRNATLRADIGVNPGGMFAVGGGGQATMAGGSDTLQPTQVASADMATAMQLLQRARTPQQMAIAKQMVEQAQQANDPLRQLQIQKARRDLEGDGARPMTDDERAAYKVPANQPAFMTRNGPKFGPAGNNVTNNVDTKGSQAMMENAVKGYEGAQMVARDAQKRIATYGQLAKAAEGFQTGATAQARLTAKAVLKDLGFIKGEDVPDGEAFNAIAKRLELAAAPKGQGQITENERAIIRDTIPSITKSPEAIGLIVRNLQKLDEYDIKVAQIYRDNARRNGGLPNAIQVAEEIAALGPPMDDGEIVALQGLTQRATAPAATSTDPVRVTTPDEARKLPKGTRIILPDGSPGIVR